MDPDDLAWSRAYTLRNEGGYVLTAYWDDIGKCWTVGAGCTCPAIIKGTVWTEQQATQEFYARHNIALQGAMTDVGPDTWQALDGPRQAALVDQAFQMGETGLAGFIHELADLGAGDWNDAGAALMNSKEARQTPARAKRNYEILVTGDRLDLIF